MNFCPGESAIGPRGFQIEEVPVFIKVQNMDPRSDFNIKGKDFMFDGQARAFNCISQVWIVPLPV